MFKVSLFIVISITFIGCFERTPKSVSAMESKKYPVLYKVNYNFECDPGYIFHKETLLAPVDISGQKINGDYKIPDSVIGLEIWKTFNGISYMLIYPDGSFASSHPIVHYFEDGKYIMQDNVITCNTKDSVPFSQIENDKI
ncbi:hypothetical protein N9A28_05915 [Sulfurimonas sp.]|nr:hypothetical protein [Sulfurimonas sp.]